MEDKWLGRFRDLKGEMEQTEPLAPSLSDYQPVSGDMTENASNRLAQYEAIFGKQSADQWLSHFDRAHAACVATFPAERQEHALKHYRAHYCEGQPARVIAAHTLSLELWQYERNESRLTSHGKCLEAACKACGIDIDALPQA